MKFLKALCALALLSSTAGLMALKVAANSPIGICTHKGYKQGTAEFEQCLQLYQQPVGTSQFVIPQASTLGLRKLPPNYTPISSSAYPSQYGPQTGIVPPHLRGQ